MAKYRGGHEREEKDDARRLVYSWEGREVEATPRSLRPPLDESASAWRRACDRETTPDRALRKMVAKVKRQCARAARGAVAGRAAPRDW